MKINTKNTEAPKKAIGPINVFPVGVRSKFFRNDAIDVKQLAT